VPELLKSVQPKLIYRFIALFMVMALLVAATGSFGIWKVSQLGSHLEGMLKKRAALEKMAALMKVTAHECQVYLLVAAVVSNDMEEFERNRIEYRLKQEWFRQYCAVLLKGDARIYVETAQQGSILTQKVKSVEENWAAFETVADRLLSSREILLKADSPATINKGVRNVLIDEIPGARTNRGTEAAMDRVDMAIDEVLVTISGMMIETSSEVKTIQQRARIAFIAVIFLAVMLAVILGMLATRRIIIPLTELDLAAHRLAKGDLSARVSIKAGGEIQKLFDSFNQMAENLGKRTSDLLNAQEELILKEKLSILGQLSGSVGHELRNPLGVMNNAVFFLKMILADADESTQEYLEIIKQEINNSERIISDLLDFTRTKTPLLIAVTAGELIADSLSRCPIPENVILHKYVPQALPPLKVDPLQMRQVLQNLLINAVQAMPDGGVLQVAARKVRSKWDKLRREGELELEPRTSRLDPFEDFIEISVTDTGVGIPPENMKKLFQPLFTTKAKGIGLGMVVCRNLVGVNGGRIEVESESGNGTTFTVILPIERSSK